jgi:hypothetical protein
LHQNLCRGGAEAKYNYSAAMGFNGDVAVVNNFFYLFSFDGRKILLELTTTESISFIVGASFPINMRYFM